MKQNKHSKTAHHSTATAATAVIASIIPTESTIPTNNIPITESNNTNKTHPTITKSSICGQKGDEKVALLHWLGNKAKSDKELSEARSYYKYNNKTYINSTTNTYTVDLQQ